MGQTDDDLCDELDELDALAEQDDPVHIELRTVRRQWDRDRAAITAFQARVDRNPVASLLWRRPWRARSRPNWRRPREIVEWLRLAHDCADGSIACTCAGGFRYPSR